MRIKKYTALSLIFLVICWGIGMALSGSHSKTEIFKQYKEDFELITKELLDMTFDNHKIESYGIMYNEAGIIVGFYEMSNPLSDEMLVALNNLSTIFTQDFSFISVDEDRVNYGGLGTEMYVFSVSDKKPTYFYHEGDGINFSCERIDDHWYYLHNRVR